MSDASLTESQQSIAPPALREVLDRIQSFYDPCEVWLFGSRARGMARDGSDWDLLVVVDDATPDSVIDPHVGWRLQRGAGAPADIVCYRAAEFAAERGVRNTLAYEVVHCGGRRLDVGH